MKEGSEAARTWDEVVGEADSQGLQVTSPAMESRLQSWLTHPDTELTVLRHTFTLSGDLDPARLRGAWDRVVERHVNLHVQPVVHGKHIWLRDVGGGPRLSEEPLGDPITHGDPFRDPLVRAALRTRGDQWVLELEISHLVADGPSVAIVLRELSEFYRDPGADLPTPGSFVAWADRQRRLAFTEKAMAADVWWRHRFEHRDTSRRLLDLAPAASQQVDILATPEIRHLAEEARRRHRVTLYTLSLWATAAELCREGRDDIVFTTSWGHRRSAEDQTVVGCLTSRTLLALDRTTILRGPRAVQNEAWDTFGHTLAPYAHIRAVALGGSGRAVDSDPNIPHFAFGESVAAALTLDGVTSTEVVPSSDTGAKSLEFWFEHAGSHLQLAVCGPHEGPDLRRLGVDVMNGLTR